ncbi:MAG: hypothetical protein LAN62_06095 [Acidobacteriia bacterium]|nr:hypothetical protein [Terriglobia bacterium]
MQHAHDSLAKGQSAELGRWPAGRLETTPAGRPDFLRKDAQTPISRAFHVAGVRLFIETNSETILESAHEAFASSTPAMAGRGAKLRLWVDPSGNSGPPWPKPYFRGLSHLIFGGFDSQNSFLIDLRTGTVLGRFSPKMAADRSMWKTVIFPVIFSALAPSLDLAVLHCGCVGADGGGLLLAGESGQGKSTLAVALAQVGFRFLSDDRTVLSLTSEGLTAWSVLPGLKLRPDARSHFDGLADLQPAPLWGGEEAYRVDAREELNVHTTPRCEPRWLIFLERQPIPEFTLRRISAPEAAARMEAGLPQEIPAALAQQRRTIAALVQRDCWVLRHGGDPHAVARALRDWVKALGSRRTRLGETPPAPLPRIEVARRDPLRRFTPTPFVAQVSVMDRTLRVETNNPQVLKCVRQLFDRYGPAPAHPPQFLWRIVTEPDSARKPPWPEMTAFSGPGLRVVNLGQRSFLAVDLEAREGVGFLAEGLAAEETGFASIYLAALFYLTAPVLGLVSVTAACVVHKERGILVFGEPASGKTTSSYLAERLGLEFHSDQATFLEFEGHRLRAWGDFWPDAFRAEASQFLPELSSQASAFSQGRMTFLALSKSRTPRPARSVFPAACILLEKRAMEAPRLTPLPAPELSQRLKVFVPFKDEARFEAQRESVFRRLAELPAFRLTCGEPWAAARFYRSVLSMEQLLEERE